MSNIVISREKIEKQMGVVVLPLKHYRELIQRATPTYYLSGKDAAELDKTVEDGIKAVIDGKTKKLRSLADLD